MISKCTTNDIMTYTSSKGVLEHISHKLLHMIVERDPPPRANGQPRPLTDRYSTFHIDVASNYVAKRLTGISLFLSLSKMYYKLV